MESKKKKKIRTDWVYTDIVKEHFFHPKNMIKEKDIKRFKADGIGVVGSPVCGDVMKMFIKVKAGKIKNIKWQTFGCATAIASTSIFSEIVKGMKIEDALKITPKYIIQKLGGLPNQKIHCSVLADQAFKAAVKDYKEKHKK